MQLSPRLQSGTADAASDAPMTIACAAAVIAGQIYPFSVHLDPALGYAKPFKSSRDIRAPTPRQALCDQTWGRVVDLAMRILPQQIITYAPLVFLEHVPPYAHAPDDRWFDWTHFHVHAIRSQPPKSAD